MWHSGGFVGYTAQFERFPAFNTSIIVLCNSASIRPDALAHGIADIVLEDDLTGKPKAGDAVAPKAAAPVVELSAAELDAWVATYRETSTGSIISLERSGDVLELVVDRERIALVPTGERTFRLGAGPEHVEFGGVRPRRSLVVRREVSSMVETFEEIELHAPSADVLAALAGRYRSDEIGTEWTLSLSGGALVVDGPVFDEPAPL